VAAAIGQLPVLTGDLRINQLDGCIIYSALFSPGKLNLGWQAMPGGRDQGKSKTLRCRRLFGLAGVIDFDSVPVVTL